METHTCALPNVKIETVASIFKTVYGKDPVHIERLPGYVDNNFFVKLRVEDALALSCDNDQFVLKFMNRRESLQPSYYVTQQELMEHLVSREVRTCSPVRTASCDRYTIIVFKDGSYNFTGKPNPEEICQHLVHVLTYVPGRQLEDASLRDLSSTLRQAGLFLGGLMHAMEDFRYDEETADALYSVWHPSSLDRLPPFFTVISDERRRRMAESITQEFVTHVRPRLANMPRGLIHADVSPNNLIIPANCTVPTTKDFSLIDFGDMHTNNRVFEVALAVSDFTMRYFSDLKDAFLIRQYVLEGLEQVLRLSPDEKDVLEACIKGRILQLWVFGRYYHARDPTNDSLEPPAFAWEVLEQLHADGK